MTDQDHAKIVREAGMRVLVCGGRDFANRHLFHATMCEVLPWHEPDQYGNTLPKGVTIMHGGCPTGADQMADDWAVVHWCDDLLVFPADWQTYRRAAGPIRNQRMLDEGKPDLVIAFPGGRGTADMVRRAKAAGVKVHEVTP